MTVILLTISVFSALGNGSGSIYQFQPVSPDGNISSSRQSDSTATAVLPDILACQIITTSYGFGKASVIVLRSTFKSTPA